MGVVAGTGMRTIDIPGDVHGQTGRESVLGRDDLEGAYGGCQLRPMVGYHCGM